MTVSYQLPWDGTPLASAGGVLAFDTETEWIGSDDEDARRIPRLALATASSLDRNVVLPPSLVPRFFQEHRHCHLALHNCSFDFWVVVQAFPELRDTLFDMVAANLWHDTMMADQLIRIARGQPFFRRNLAEVAAEYAGIVVDKSDPFRKRFGELLGIPESEWHKLDPGWFQYAAGDTAATLPVWLAQRRVLAELDERAGLKPYRAKLWPQFGVGTEQIQVKGAIALAEASRVGFRIDSEEAAKICRRLTDEIEKQVQWIDSRYPAVFKHSSGCGTARQVLRIKDSRQPQFNMFELQELLESLCPTAPRTARRSKKKPQGAVTTALDVWKELLPDNEFVKHWAECVDNCKLLQFVEQYEQQPPPDSLFDTDADRQAKASLLPYRSHVRPRYETLKITGRTSCYDPNLQQTPRKGWFRAMFCADEGYTLIVNDYSGIEMVTLAAVILRRFGTSRLAEVITAGRDVHSYTAAMFSGMDYDDLIRWINLDKNDPRAKDPMFKKCKDARQMAKPVNFGVPGGLHDEALATYAKLQYGVSMTVEQAGILRTKLITEVYPDLGRYLTDDPLRILAVSIRGKREDLARKLRVDINNVPGWFGPWVKKIVSGNAFNKQGNPYAPDTVNQIWDGLKYAAGPDCPQEYMAAFVRREGSPRLAEALFASNVVTLTGRIRGRASFTESRNTPFQGLAGDGAKLAMWEILNQVGRKRGYRIAAFIHDEIVTQVPTHLAEQAKEEITGIMRAEMSRVIQCDIPVSVASAITERWEKP